MSDRPVCLYADIADAETDYEAVFDLRAVGAIGTFDSAVIREKATMRATKLIEKQIDADADELKRETDAAAENADASS